MTTPRAYPLQWPSGWPVTTSRETGRFRDTLSGALSTLRDEVRRLGGTNLVLSSNATLGEDRPKHPGVCAYFQLRNQGIAVPCDRWQRVEHNVKAIALTIKAMRGMERWGAKHMITAMFQGFKALPEKSGAAWSDILGVSPTATEKEIMQAYYAKAQTEHPDKGGTHDRFAALNQAKDIGLSSLRHR